MLFGETFPKLRVPATYEAWRDHFEMGTGRDSCRRDHPGRTTDQ